jgi:hypothetical protein
MNRPVCFYFIQEVYVKTCVFASAATPTQLMGRKEKESVAVPRTPCHLSIPPLSRLTPPPPRYRAGWLGMLVTPLADMTTKPVQAPPPPASPRPPPAAASSNRAKVWSPPNVANSFQKFSARMPKNSAAD